MFQADLQTVKARLKRGKHIDRLFLTFYKIDILVRFDASETGLGQTCSAGVCQIRLEACAIAACERKLGKRSSSIPLKTKNKYYHQPDLIVGVEDSDQESKSYQHYKDIKQRLPNKP